MGLCVALQTLAALGLLGFVLAFWPQGQVAPALPPTLGDGPSSIRSVEDPMLVSPNHKRPAQSHWM